MRIAFRLVDHGAALGVGIEAIGHRWAWRFRNPFVRIYSQEEFRRRKARQLVLRHL